MIVGQLRSAAAGCRSAAQILAGAARAGTRAAAAAAAPALPDAALSAAAAADQAVRHAAGALRITAARQAEKVSQQAEQLVRHAAEDPSRVAADLNEALHGVLPATGQAARTLADLGPRRGQRRVWSDGGHAAIEVRGLTGRGKTHRRVADGVTESLRRVRGVRWAEVNAVTAQVLIAFDDRKLSVPQLIDAVQGVEEARGTSEDEFPWDRPVPPSDNTPLIVAGTALAADLAGVCTGVAGRVLRIRPLHPAARVPLAVLDGYPRVRGILAGWIGPVGADVLLAVGNAAVYGLSDGPARPAVDACHRLLILAEVRSRIDLWAKRCAELSADGGPPPGELPRRPPRPCPYPDGPVESYCDQAAIGSLLAAVGVLAASRSPGRAADAILAGLPSAARLGREAFAAMLGRELARDEVLPMDPAAYRRLDRISAVVIDSAVCCGERPVVLAVTADDPAGEALVWRAATGVLRELSVADLQGPGPWEGRGHRLVRPGRRRDRGRQDAAGDRDGLALQVFDSDGQQLGEVTVGCELDPLAEAVVTAARGTGARVLISRHASAADLIARADEVIDGDLAGRIRSLAADGAGVLAITGCDDAALSAADVSMSCARPGGGVGWTADLIGGHGLAGAWRLLNATGRARTVSERGVTLAVSGSALGVLLAAVGRRAGRGASPVVSPMQAAAVFSLLQGAYTARAAARAALPPGAARTAWHAMEPADAVARLDAVRKDGREHEGRRKREPGAAGPGQRPAAAAAVLRPLRWGSELAAAAAGELRDPLTPVLVIGAAATAVLGSGVDSALVGSVMVGNALVGGVQRMRTERALRDLLLRERQVARRIGREPGSPVPELGSLPEAQSVPADELRAGDLIALRADDVVPADARLVAADSLEVDESALTGESLPVGKDVAPAFGAVLADRSCMLYEGTTVLAGTALAVVVATGEATEAGRAGAAAAAPRPTGVQARLGELTRLALPATGVGGLAVASPRRRARWTAGACSRSRVHQKS